jgi:5,10-methylenetetrahydromethanopterin reductase
VRFGVSLIGDDTPTWQDHLHAVDTSGFWALGIGDSQSIYPDAYVRMTLAASATSSVRLATWVSNPVTRHPAVSAGAMATLQDVSGGRIVFGIGTGDSALANIGRGPSSLTTLENYVHAVRGLLADGHATWAGRPASLTVPGGPVPIYIAGSGPRTLRLAGRIGDGVIVGTGVEPEVADDALEAIAAGAADSGRGLDDLDVWWLLMANLADDDATAVGEIRNSLVTYANLAFRLTLHGKRLPAEHEAAIRRIHQEYRPLEHARFGPSHHADLADSLGLTPYLRERFALCGTPADFLARARTLGERGCRNLWLTVRVPDKARFLRLWNDEVQPHLATL